MSDEITPALTTDEWADKLVHHPGELFLSIEPGVEDHPVLIVGDDNGSGSPEFANARSRHALAALALYGQPFGFTAEVVDTLRNVAAMIELNGYHTSSADLETIADRIAALLPPREAK